MKIFFQSPTSCLIEQEQRACIWNQKIPRVVKPILSQMVAHLVKGTYYSVQGPEFKPLVSICREIHEWWSILNGEARMHVSLCLFLVSIQQIKQVYTRTRHLSFSLSIPPTPVSLSVISDKIERRKRKNGHQEYWICPADDNHGHKNSNKKCVS